MVKVTPQRRFPSESPRTSTSVSSVDVAVGVSTLVVGTGVVVVRTARPVIEELLRVGLCPPLVPPRLQPRRWLDALGHLGAEQRASSGQGISRLLDGLVPALADGLLRRVDLTAMLTKYVDLDGVVAQADLNAAASRLDVDAIARRLDVELVLDRIDLTDLVLKRVDLDAIASRLDLDAVLDRIDLTTLVLERVDLDALVNAILERIDLVALTEDVIDAVDLPEIIRESTGSMASDTVQRARMQGIAADEAVSRVRSGLFLRRSRQAAQSIDTRPAPGQGATSPAGPTQPPRHR